MNYLDYLQMMADDAAESLRRANARYIDALRRTAQRSEEQQVRMDSGEYKGWEGSIVDIMEESFSWVENEARHVRTAKDRYIKAKAQLEAAGEMGHWLSTAKLSVDTLIAYGLEQEAKRS